MKNEPTPRQKALRQRIASLAGRIGATSRTLKPGYDGREATSAAKDAYWARLMAEVDPQGQLGPDERLAKAKQRWRLRMHEGQLKRAQTRLKKAS